MADAEKKDTADVKKVKKPHSPRNYKLPGGVWRYSRSSMYSRRRLAKVKKDTTPKPKPKRKPRYIIKPIGGEKNGGKRRVRLRKERKFYPTEDKPRLKKTRKMVPFKKHKRYLRKSITPGSVLILLAGRHRGKRVVFLKQLDTGLLLVTGPYKLNGCPLRRINQIYCLATSTKLDISNVKIPEHLDDLYFRRTKPQKKSKKDEEEIFDTKKEEYSVTEQRKKDQIEVDRQIIDVIKAH
ncbi:60S ribosomal protein L6, partial [Stegodyphus mimosarum]